MKCPKCDSETADTLELIPGVACVNSWENGEPDYGGETEVLWDEQTTIAKVCGHCATTFDFDMEKAHRLLARLQGTS